MTLVAVRYQPLPFCVSAWLSTALLLVNTACGTECSASAGRHPCADESHYLECGGGEGYEYNQDFACPDIAPVCMDFAGSSLCHSHEESECLVLDEALRGSSVRAADLNGDGLSDLVFLESGSLSSALAVSRGGFAVPTTVAQGVDGFELVELTQDEQADLVLLESGKVVLVPGAGDGSFDVLARRVLLEKGKALLGVVDVDADGFNDIVVSNAAEKLTVLPGGADYAPLPLELDAPSTPIRVFAADLDGDGPVELLVEGGRAQVGVYHLYVDAWIQTDTLLGSIALLADLDGDDRPDLVVNEADSQAVTVRLGQPGGGFEGGASFDGEAFMADDIDADGHVDMLLSRRLQLQVVRLDGHGDGTFTEASPLDIHDSPNSAQTILTGSETRIVFAAGNGFVTQLKADCLKRP